MPQYDTRLSFAIGNTITTTSTSNGTYTLLDYAPTGSPPKKPAKKTFDPAGLNDTQYVAMVAYVNRLNRIANATWERDYSAWRYRTPPKSLPAWTAEMERQTALGLVPSADARLYDAKE